MQQIVSKVCLDTGRYVGEWPVHSALFEVSAQKLSGNEGANLVVHIGNEMLILWRCLDFLAFAFCSVIGLTSIKSFIYGRIPGRPFEAGSNVELKHVEVVMNAVVEKNWRCLWRRSKYQYH